MNRNRLYRVCQGMAGAPGDTVSPGRIPDRSLSQEAGGGRRRQRRPIRLSPPWGIALAVAGPILAGLIAGLIHRRLRQE